MIPLTSLSAADVPSFLHVAADPTIRLSVVVPCFNEQDVLREFERRMCHVCDKVAPGQYEIVLVNDGSRDSTGDIIAEMAHRNHTMVGVELSRNFGHQIALTAGLSFARGQIILVIDADLQDPPELLPDMLKLLNEGANVVYGKRARRQGETGFKLRTAKLFYRVLERLTDFPIPIDTGDFRLMDRKTLLTFLSMPEQYRFIRGMIAWIGLRQVELLYDRRERYAGETKYTLRKMVFFALDAITGFSIAPLRLAFFLAIISISLAALVSAYSLFVWMIGTTVPGWTSLLLLFLLFSSIQLICISIVGEYVGRTYMQTKQRPLYVVKAVHTTAEHGEKPRQPTSVAVPSA
jgi:glycosyltransferase involved in cell wall biosynthesis